MYSTQHDGNALFSGGGFMPSQATQAAGGGTGSSSKSRATQGVFPVTVKQISEAVQSGEEKSNFVIDGADVTNVKLLGLVVNKMERVTDVSFTLDDGTGRMEISRWVNEASDTNEMAAIQNGMYVKVNGHLKGFQGKLTVMAFSVRAVTDFDDVTLHFIECMHVHLVNTRVLGGDSTLNPNPSSVGVSSPYQNVGKGYQTAVSNQFSAPSSLGNSGDINDLVIGIFQDPANVTWKHQELKDFFRLCDFSLAREHGLHIEEVANQLRAPLSRIRQAIDYLINEGVIYSTIDDDHFKSTCNG